MLSKQIITEDIETIFLKDIDWSRFQNKIVLITGANGFLSAYIVETLLLANERGIDIKIIALVRNIEKAKLRFKNHLNNSALQFLHQDVCAILPDTLKADFIIHAASQASPKYYQTDPVGTLNANVKGTINLLELAKNNNVESFLYFSSAEIYGQPINADQLLSELDYGYLDPAVVRSCYAESKRMGETLCISYYQQYKVKAKIVRPFHTYGPGMELNDGRVFADFVSDVLSNRNITMNSDGSARRAYCYITDAVEAYFRVLLEGKDAEAYNVGNPENELSIMELGELIVSLFPEKKLKVIRQSKVTEGYLSSEVSKVLPNIEKLKKLGWYPQVSAKMGFYRTVLSYG